MAVIGFLRRVSVRQRGSVLRGAAWTVLVASIGIAAIVGMTHLQRYVTARGQTPTLGVQVRLADWPWWMPTQVVRDVAISMVPQGMTFDDPQLVQRVFELASANPWVLGTPVVTKRRGDDAQFGLVEVKAEFREPVARIVLPSGDDEYVDAQGYRLPAEQVPHWMASLPAAADQPARNVCFVSASDVPSHLSAIGLHYVRIEGIEAPPPLLGKPWEGADLADGVKLVQLVVAKPYYQQIVKVDVRNHAGRISRQDAIFRLWAQAGKGPLTEIRLDRFAELPGDYVVTPERGMMQLDDYFVHHGTLAGVNEWLDARYDTLHVSVN